MTFAAAPAAQAQQAIEKQVHLVVDGQRLVASNVRFSRFDELRLAPRERIRETKEGKAVIIIETNRRLLAYGSISGWRSMDRTPNEQVESIAAEDNAGLVVTTERLLNFNGRSGVWAEHDRSVSR